jgi:hypothetical protein
MGAGFALAAIGTLLLSKVPPNHLIVRIEKEDDSTESSGKPLASKGWKM